MNQRNVHHNNNNQMMRAQQKYMQDQNNFMMKQYQPHNMAAQGSVDMYGQSNPYAQGQIIQQQQQMAYQQPQVNPVAFAPGNFQANSYRPPVVSQNSCCNVM